MIKIKYEFKSEIGKAINDAERAASRFLYRMGGLMRRQARSSTNKKGGGRPSNPGEPWHKGSGWLRDAIIFEKEDRDVTLGFSRFGDTAELHEFGGFRRDGFRKHVYPARPALQPAFEQAQKAAMKIMPDVYSKYFPKG